MPAAMAVAGSATEPAAPPPPPVHAEPTPPRPQAGADRLEHEPRERGAQPAVEPLEPAHPPQLHVDDEAQVPPPAATSAARDQPLDDGPQPVAGAGIALQECVLLR